MKRPVIVGFLFLTAGVAFAQTESARISGRVTDLTGAVFTRRRLSPRPRSETSLWKGPDAELDL